MNPVSLTMHTVVIVFGYVLYLINPGWDAGLTLMCAGGLAWAGALSVGGFRNHTAHQATTGGATIDQPGGTGAAMRERLLMLDKRVRVVTVQTRDAVEWMYAGIGVSGMAICAALIVLMSTLPFIKL